MFLYFMDLFEISWCKRKNILYPPILKWCMCPCFYPAEASPDPFYSDTCPGVNELCPSIRRRLAIRQAGTAGVGRKKFAAQLLRCCSHPQCFSVFINMWPVLLAMDATFHWPPALTSPFQSPARCVASGADRWAPPLILVYKNNAPLKSHCNDT